MGVSPVKDVRQREVRDLAILVVELVSNQLKEALSTSNGRNLSSVRDLYTLHIMLAHGLSTTICVCLFTFVSVRPDC